MEFPILIFSNLIMKVTYFHFLFFDALKERKLMCEDETSFDTEKEG